MSQIAPYIATAASTGAVGLAGILATYWTSERAAKRADQRLAREEARALEERDHREASEDRTRHQGRLLEAAAAFLLADQERTIAIIQRLRERRDSGVASPEAQLRVVQATAAMRSPAAALRLLLPSDARNALDGLGATHDFLSTLGPNDDATRAWEELADARSRLEAAVARILRGETAH